jgi:hypothetical protein
MLLVVKPSSMEAATMILSSVARHSKADSVLELAADLVAFARQSALDGSTFDQFERGVFARLRSLGKTSTDLFLDAQGNGDLGKEVRVADGSTLYRSDEPQARPLRTIFGEHAFEAYVYSQGPKQKIELRPIDARLNLPDGKASYLFQEFSQLFCVEKAFAVGAGQFEKVFGQKVSVDVLEGINRDMGGQAEQFLNEQLPKPKAKEEGELLVLTADAKGVPLVKADVQRVPAFDAKERPGNRRMATLGCVYSVDRFVRTAEQVVAALFRESPPDEPGERPKPCGKHYRGYFAYQPEGEAAIPGAIRTWTWLSDEAAKRHRSGQTIVRLMDGQPILWESADACLDDYLRQQQEPGKKVRVIDVLDVLHVSSYVWKAAKVFHRHKEHQEAFARCRLLRILRGDVAGVIRGLRRMASLNELSPDGRETITTVCNYFENNIGRMRYDEYLREGYPIATGVIEGACRHVIKDRMEQGGMRWTLKGAEAMLNLRAVWASDLAEEFAAWRQQEKAKQVHPFRRLVDGYQVLNA